MTEDEIKSLEGVKEKREAITEKIQNDMDEIAKELPSSHGKLTLSTEEGKWTMKHNNSECEWLRFQNETKIYVISQYDPPPIQEFVEAIKDYENFIESYNEWITSLKEKLDITLSGPDIEKLKEIKNLVEEKRDKIKEQLDDFVSQLPNKYGKIIRETDEGKWTLKHDKDRVKWLNFRNSYIISQKDPATITATLEAFEDYPNFIEKLNEYIEDKDEAIENLEV